MPKQKSLREKQIDLATRNEYGNKVSASNIQRLGEQKAAKAAAMARRVKKADNFGYEDVFEEKGADFMENDPHAPTPPKIENPAELESVSGRTTLESTSTDNTPGAPRKKSTKIPDKILGEAKTIAKPIGELRKQNPAKTNTTNKLKERAPRR